MRIVLGSDHRGVALKTALVDLLNKEGHDVVDVGTHSEQSVDYPDIASAVASQVSSGEAERGILICGTGFGMQITANKFARVRAATIRNESEAAICRRHNDVNVLCLAGDQFNQNQPADALVDIWLHTEFEGGRHARRVDKIKQLEKPCEQ